MVVYTEPTVNETKSIEAIGSYINTVSEGIFGLWLLIGIFGVTFFNSLLFLREPSRAFLVSSFFTSIIAIMFGLLGWINPMFMYLFILMTAFGIMWRFLSSRRV